MWQLPWMSTWVWPVTWLVAPSKSKMGNILNDSCWGSLSQNGTEIYKNKVDIPHR